MSLHESANPNPLIVSALRIVIVGNVPTSPEDIVMHLRDNWKHHGMGLVVSVMANGSRWTLNLINNNGIS
jgi:hypothetical protein